MIKWERAPGKLGASDFTLKPRGDSGCFAPFCLKCAYAVICDFLPKRSCIVLSMTKGPVASAIDAAKKSDAAALNVLASPLLFSNREVVIERAAALRLAAIYQ